VESIAGSGIGLAGAKRIVELHQGTISVTSAEGEGSTFTVRLPIGVEEFSKGQVREPDPAVGSG
jgi:signal transduction histidine kinase